ncbi:10979_t:CDS:10 [Ambispora gerdemannii]|uniref:NADPH-dependent diflavin oxidoreductase 1 n=1 Tax=Ambispora gerdemannii TaxID=144530 RepID=A0A9N8YY71_9GLOM|nr:10979_t:CDS:10 [Ambispora gerdemannii]
MSNPTENKIVAEAKSESSLDSREILILFGSQTGCAQDVAERIGREAKRRLFKIRVFAMDAYDKVNLINESLVVFVCSTTGQGEEPDNMKKFWKFLLRKNLPNDILSHLKFTVFGLGDSSYLRYNWPAKKLYKRLLQLGAQSIHPRGDGDDQHYLGYDGALDPWLSGLWEILMNEFPLPSGMEIIPPDIISDGEFFARILKNERITSHDHFQDVRHMELEFDIDDVNVNDLALNYKPGDVVVIRPKNLSEEVEEFIQMMDWVDIADDAFTLIPNQESRKVPVHWDQVLTLRKLFENHLDIFSTPRRSFFEMLAFFTTNENHTEKLREFCSPEGQDDLYAYNQRVRRTIAEVLQDFPSAKIPYDYILDIFPEIQPRQFSISSSSQSYPRCIHLTVAVVKYKTRMQKPRCGVCTKWLAGLMTDSRIPLKISKGSMRLPTSLSTPIMLIGPGTGVAVMRAFIQERILQGATENYLFFGCRYREKDYFYKSEWEEYIDAQQLKIFTAFSRDQDKKIYVQDLITENAHLIWDIIHAREGCVYLSGRSDSMPTSVVNAFKQVFISEGNLDEEKANKYFDKLERSKRFQQECY